MTLGELRKKDGHVIPSALGVGNDRLDADNNPGAPDGDAARPIREVKTKLEFGHRRNEPVKHAIRTGRAEILGFCLQFGPGI